MKFEKKLTVGKFVNLIAISTVLLLFVSGFFLFRISTYQDKIRYDEMMLKSYNGLINELIISEDSLKQLIIIKNEEIDMKNSRIHLLSGRTVKSS